MEDEIPEIARLRRIAHRMDTAFHVPVVGVRVGWDSVLGLVPGIGDALTLAPSLYIVAAARRQGASTGTLVRMGANIGIDLAIGTIPLIGDLFDVGWKANHRNVDLLARDLAAAQKKGRPADRP